MNQEQGTQGGNPQRMSEMERNVAQKEAQKTEVLCRSAPCIASLCNILCIEKPVQVNLEHVSQRTPPHTQRDELTDLTSH